MRGTIAPRHKRSRWHRVGVSVDSYGNIFFIDENHHSLRVVYKGGAAVANAIVAAQVPPTTLTPANLIPGYVYLLAGEYTYSGTSSVSPASPYYCNQNATGPQPVPTNAQSLTGCPGGYAYIQPRGIALDSEGNVFFTTQAGRQGIEVFYIQGQMAANLILVANNANAVGSNGAPLAQVQAGYTYQILGSSSGGYTADGNKGGGLTAKSESPKGLYVDANENIYYTDTDNNLVREVENVASLSTYGPTAAVSTIAGTCYNATAPCESAAQLGLPPGAGDGGPALNANFNYPYAVAVDAHGNVFIADSGQNGTTTAPIYGRVRVVYAGGTLPGISSPQVGYIYTYAGGGTSAATNIAALTVQFDTIEGLSIDSSGYLYVTETKDTTTTSNRVWRIDPVTGIATIVAGTGGAALTASATPLACGATPGPTHTDKYGSGCPATQSPIGTATGNFVFDKLGNAYLADSSFNLIREYSYNTLFPSEPVGTSSGAQYVAFDFPAGTSVSSLGFTVQGTPDGEYVDAGAPADSCVLPGLFATDTVCAFDVTFTPSKIGLRNGAAKISGLAGPLYSEQLSGTGTGVELGVSPGTAGTLSPGTGVTPHGVAVDAVGNAYISDSTGNRVVKIPSGGGVATSVVTGLGNPHEVAVDGAGNVYVADTVNNRIVKEPATGGAPTYLGTGLKAPQGVAVDALGNVYAADTGNARVVEFGAANGSQSVVAISPDFATLVSPTYLTIDAAGNMYIVDSGVTPSQVVELPISGVPTTVPLPSTVSGAQVKAPVAMAVDLAGDLYFADPNLADVMEATASGTNSLLAGLPTTTPFGLAIDSTGKLYLADSTTFSGTIGTVNPLIGLLTMPQTNTLSSSLPSTLIETNQGNTSLTLGIPFYTESGANANAFQVTNGTPACTATEVLALGAVCEQTVVFSPTAGGTNNAQLNFTGTGTVANLTAFATNLVLTTTAVTPASTVTSPIIVNIGGSLTLSIQAAPKSGTGVPTGSLTIVIDGIFTYTEQLPAGSDVYGFSVPAANLQVGSHTVTIAYSGDATYAASTASAYYVVNKITTNLACSIVRGAGGYIDTATLTASASYTAETGTEIFYSDGNPVGSYPPSGTAVDVLQLPDGQHVISATYSGDTNYLGSSCAPQTITVSHAVTTTTLATAAVVNNGAAAIRLTANVSSAVSGTITGPVTFYNGTTLIGTANVTAGTATLYTNTTVYPGYSFCAVYGGDGNYSPGVQTCATQNPDFVMLPVAPLSVVDGYQTQVNLMIVPINGYTGTLQGTCSNLPSDTICRFFNPAATVLAANNSCQALVTPGTVPCASLQIFTGINPATGLGKRPAEPCCACYFPGVACRVSDTAAADAVVGSPGDAALCWVF